jgi:hypothetical protein
MDCGITRSFLSGAKVHGATPVPPHAGGLSPFTDLVTRARGHTQRGRCARVPRGELGQPALNSVATERLVGGIGLFSRGQLPYPV